MNTYSEMVLKYVNGLLFFRNEPNYHLEKTKQNALRETNVQLYFTLKYT